MTTKEFFDLIDMKKINEIGMQIIIPIKEKFPIDESKSKNNFIVNTKKKIIFDECGAIPEDYEPFVDAYFKVCRASNKKSECEYDLIDLLELADKETCYVHDSHKNVWLIINF